MPSDFDRRFDAARARLTGPGGELESVGEPGGAVPVALPATLPGFFRHFCARYAALEAVVADEERLSFAALGSGKIDRAGLRFAYGMFSDPRRA